MAVYKDNVFESLSSSKWTWCTFNSDIIMYNNYVERTIVYSVLPHFYIKVSLCWKHFSRFSDIARVQSGTVLISMRKVMPNFLFHMWLVLQLMPTWNSPYCTQGMLVQCSVLTFLFGLPSCISCTCGCTTLYNERGLVPRVNYEVIRPLYTSSSLPHVTRVSFEQTQTRTGVTYTCIVYVEGHRNIASASGYDFVFVCIKCLCQFISSHPLKAVTMLA